MINGGLPMSFINNKFLCFEIHTGTLKNLILYNYKNFNYICRIALSTITYIPRSAVKANLAISNHVKMHSPKCWVFQKYIHVPRTLWSYFNLALRGLQQVYFFTFKIFLHFIRQFLLSGNISAWKTSKKE